MKNLFLLFFSFFVPVSLLSQVFQRLHAPVEINDTNLPNPWAGGLNAPQWAKTDLNGDGKKDLYAFDRNGEVHIPFLNISGVGETKYEFAPYLSALFPSTRYFVLLRDYNHDGIDDLFACSFDEGLAGLKVFKGRYQDNKLAFDRLQFDWDFNILTIPAGNGLAQLLVNNPDYPAIDDLDNDGDLDILAMSTSPSYVTYYENQAIEKGFTDDTLLFEIKDNCWGKVYLGAFAQQFKLSGSPDTCANFFASEPVKEDRDGERHGGATLLTFDADNDGDKELTHGDLIYENVSFLKNGGTKDNAWMTEQDNHFPIYDQSADIINFPATYYFDMDNDGLNDFIASPNDPSGSLDLDVTWFYKNIQSNEFPAFQLQEKRTIVKDMIDLGTGAHPALVDYNADGLLDLVVGNEEVWTTPLKHESSLYLFENVGTATEPQFRLVNTNWLNFKQFTTLDPPSYSFTPAFGDMDNDGDQDLLVGEIYGSIFFVENIAGAGNPMAFGPIQPLWKNIAVGQYATPFVHDVNKDGKPDLLIGELRGNVNYLPNIGTLSNPDFVPDPDLTPNNSKFGNADMRQPFYSTGFSSPFMLEFGDTSYLVSGSERGWLEVYLVNPDSIDGGSFDIVSEQFGNLREGFITFPAFGNLNNDDFIDAVVGNNRGGMGFFSSPFKIDGSVPAKETRPSLAFFLSPNPAGDWLRVQTPVTGNLNRNYHIFNALGQPVGQGKLSGSDELLSIESLPGGLYFLEISEGGTKGVQRFVKH
jgi:hypothetical protein